jgi:glyoxylase-like metal-dependent hydrolase (beta-lactamase superfamily II)
MQKITENIYVETGFHGCNTSFIVTTAGVVVIDTPMVPSEAKKWKEEASKYGPVRYVINTEPHTDHAAGNCWFDAPVISHQGTRSALIDATVEDLVNALRGQAPEGLPLDTEFRYHLPDITFSESLTFYLGRHTFHLINMPGHTASETAVYVPEEKVVFTGDNLNLRIPIFIKSFPYEWLKSLKRLQLIDADRFVPGHGGVSDKSCIQPMYDGVQYWINTVKDAVDKGMCLEETLDKVDVTDRYPVAKEPWLRMIVRNSIVDLYQSLKA